MRPFLALLLFLPAFAILTALYLRRPAGARWPVWVDHALLILAALLTVQVTVASWHLAAAQDGGNLWPDVAAALGAFHSYPLILLLAWWLRRPRRAPNP